MNRQNNLICNDDRSRLHYISLLFYHYIFFKYYFLYIFIESSFAQNNNKDDKDDNKLIVKAHIHLENMILKIQNLYELLVL